MSRKKSDRLVWQHKFTLSSDNPDDVRLHEHLVELADQGVAAEWMRDNLTALVLAKRGRGTTVVPQKSTTVVQDEPADTTYAPLEDIA